MRRALNGAISGEWKVVSGFPKIIEECAKDEEQKFINMIWKKEERWMNVQILTMLHRCMRFAARDSRS